MDPLALPKVGDPLHGLVPSHPTVMAPGVSLVAALQRARKAIKRLRYAGELTEPVDGKAGRIARKAKHLQTELGEHHDAVVSAGFLAGLGTRIGTRPGDNGFTYGFLMADELSTAERIRASLMT